MGFDAFKAPLKVRYEIFVLKCLNFLYHQNPCPVEVRYLWVWLLSVRLVEAKITVTNVSTIPTAWSLTRTQPCHLNQGNQISDCCFLLPESKLFVSKIISWSMFLLLKLSIYGLQDIVVGLHTNNVWLMYSLCKDS